MVPDRLEARGQLTNNPGFGRCVAARPRVFFTRKQIGLQLHHFLDSSRSPTRKDLQTCLREIASLSLSRSVSHRSFLIFVTHTVVSIHLESRKSEIQKTISFQAMVKFQDLERVCCKLVQQATRHMN